MEQDQLVRWADYLGDAARDCHPVEQLSVQVPGVTVEDGYRVQAAGLAIRERQGERVVGAKAGLTSVAKQQQMGVHEPIFGWLTDAMEVDAEAGIETARLIHPRVEPEVVFVMGEPVEGDHAGPSEVLAATAAVRCGLEVLDSRYTDFRFSLPDVVADNTSAAGFVLGPPVPLPESDLAATQVELRIDGQMTAKATGAAVLGHPAEAVARLVRFLAGQGRRLEAGWIVLSGGLTDAAPIRPGSTVEVLTDCLGRLATRAI